MIKKPFLITIDTEGDNLWAGPREVTCHNARFLPRFQALTDRFGFKPTYLVNYEMAADPFFVEFARDALRRDAAEVGLHIHAWHSPPHDQLTDFDHASAPYLIEFRTELITAKIKYLASLLEETFGSKPISHRAGRWALDTRYARALVACGFVVDCSVTPYISWASATGAHQGGSDYRFFPTRPYFVNFNDLSRPGESSLLEVPMSIGPKRFDLSAKWLRTAYRTGVGYKLLKRVAGLEWLRPNGRNGREMLLLVDRLWSSCEPYVQFMLHSSELMPGGSPTFTTALSVEHLYDDVEALFSHLHDRYVGCTLDEFHQRFTRADQDH